MLSNPQSTREEKVLILILDIFLKYILYLILAHMWTERKKAKMEMKMPHLRDSGFRIAVFLALYQQDIECVEGRQEQTLNVIYYRGPILRKDRRVVCLQEGRTKTNKSKMKS